MYCAVGGELQRLLQVLARADDGTAHRLGVQYDIEDRKLKSARRQPDQRHRAALVEHAEALSKRSARDGGDENSMRAAYLTLHLGNDILLPRVQCDLGAELARQ